VSFTDTARGVPSGWVLFTASFTELPSSVVMVAVLQYDSPMRVAHGRQGLLE
jgi:hypothetical protein